MKTLLRSLSLSVLAALTLPAFVSAAVDTFVYTPVTLKDGSVYLFATDFQEPDVTVLPSLIPTAKKNVGIAVVDQLVCVSDGGGEVYLFFGGPSLVKGPTFSLPAAPNAPAINAIALSPDRRTLYASDYNNGLVYRVDISNPTMPHIDPPLSGFTYPLGMVVNPKTGDVFVVNSVNGQNGFVSVIDKRTFTIEKTTIPVGESPLGIAVSQDGNTVYVTNEQSSTVSVIDVSQGSPYDVKTIFLPSGSTPAGIAVIPGNGSIIVANSAGGTASSPSSAYLIRNPASSSPSVTSINGVAGWTGFFGITYDPNSQVAFVNAVGQPTYEVIHNLYSGTPTVSVGPTLLAPSLPLSIAELGNFAGPVTMP